MIDIIIAQNDNEEIIFNDTEIIFNDRYNYSLDYGEENYIDLSNSNFMIFL
jgi:hypothetical protein